MATNPYGPPAGLLGLLLGANNPVSQFTAQNRGALGGLGTSLLSSGMNFSPMQAGMALDQRAAEERSVKAQSAEQQNATRALLAKEAPDLAQLLDTGAPMEGVWSEYMRRKSPQGAAADAPSNVREWEYFNKLTPEAQGQYIRMKRANPYLDVGTGYVQPDPLNPGSPAGPEIVKDNFKPAYDAAAGTGQAKVDVETQASADSLSSKLPGLKTVVTELGELAKTATYTQTGQLFDAIVRETGNMPPEGAIARTKYIAMVDNQVLPLLRDTFGSAFTVQEGQSLRATLGDPNKSPVEKQAILEAFIEQKVRDLEALRARLPAAGSAPGRTDDIDAILRGYDL